MSENRTIQIVENGNERLAGVLSALENLFQRLNDGLFENKLSKPVITVSSNGHRKDAHGWCTVNKVWQNGETDGHFELNICAEFLNSDILAISATLLHEMIHLKNLQDDVNDCSRNRTYHNENFKRTAEKHGLRAEKVGNNGYAQTSLTNRAEKLIKSFELEKFNIYRKPQGGEQKQAKQSVVRYTCPICETIVRATRKVNIRCGDCNCMFI